MEWHSQHCNEENDDNVMCMNVWFESLGGLFISISKPYKGGKRGIKEKDFI